MTTHIDLSELTKIADNDAEFVKEIIAILMQEIPENLKNIELYILNEDIISLKKLIHKMKSSFMLVGMKALSPIAENIGKSISAEIIIELVPEYVKICKESLAELLAIQNNLNRNM
jgi:HPt (histidine-containing phosphotransfer) domain-containing protein